MKGPQSRKASVEVSKLIFVFNHNSHRVLEWSIVNSKTNFVAWKSYVLIVFRKEYYLAIFFFILSSKRAISIGIDRKNYLKIFETSRLNARGTFGRSETVYVMMDE